MALNDYSGQPLRTGDPMVKRLLAVTFPQYRGRKVKARLWKGPMVLENYWSEGSRSYYRAVRIIDGAVADFGTDNPFFATAHEPVDLPSGVILVERSIFMGREAGLTVWARANDIDAARLLGDGVLSPCVATPYVA